MCHGTGAGDLDLDSGTTERFVQIEGPAVGQPYGWDVPYGSLAMAIDPFSALFLTLGITLAALAAVFGRRFLMSYADRKLLGPPWFFFNLLVIGMIMVLVVAKRRVVSGLLGSHVAWPRTSW